MESIRDSARAPKFKKLVKAMHFRYLRFYQKFMDCSILKFYCFLGVVLIIFLYFLCGNKVDRKKVPISEQAAGKMVPELIKHMNWKYGEKVLNFGSGDGRIGYQLIFPEIVKLEGHLYSVDMLENNTLKAKLKYSDNRITYGTGTLLGLPWEFPFPHVHGKLDKIFAIYVLHLVRDLRKALRHLHSALAPGGQVAFSTLTEAAWVFKVCLTLSRMEKWNQYMDHYEMLHHPEWSSIFKDEEEGLDILSEVVEEEGYHVKYLKIKHIHEFSKDTHSYVERAPLMTPVFSRIPAELLPELKKDFLEVFSNITGIGKDGEHFKIDYQYLIGVLEKPVGNI